MQPIVNSHIKIDNVYLPKNSVGIIAAATGSRATPKTHPYLSVNPVEIALQYREWFENELITQTHTHARISEKGEFYGGQTYDPKDYEKLLLALKTHCPEHYISLTTSASGIGAEYIKHASEQLVGYDHPRNLPQMPLERSLKLIGSIINSGVFYNIDSIEDLNKTFGRIAPLFVDSSNTNGLLPTRVPLVDALSMATLDINKNSASRPDIENFFKFATSIAEDKGVGVEIEFPNYQLLEAAVKFVNGVKAGIKDGVFKKEGSIAKSIDGPVIQVLFGARSNMPPTREFMEGFLDTAISIFNPRAIFVTVRGHGVNSENESLKDSFSPEIWQHLFDFVKAGKISHLRVGIEDNFDLNEKRTSTEELLVLVNQMREDRGIKLLSPNQSLMALQSPLNRLNLENKIILEDEIKNNIISAAHSNDFNSGLNSFYPAFIGEVFKNNISKNL
jgi:hypothetical protein